MRSVIALIVMVLVMFTIGEFKHVDQPFSIPMLKDVDEFNDYIEGLNATSIEQGDSNGCYTCSSPCAMIYCCSGPYPQCCAVGGRCYCCHKPSFHVKLHARDQLIRHIYKSHLNEFPKSPITNATKHFITYNKIVINSLPKPYETDCLYRNEWPDVWPGNYLTYNQSLDVNMYDMYDDILKQNMTIDE
ncbi:unnamed protein product, partial [Medioppia subpectinata]